MVGEENFEEELQDIVLSIAPNTPPSDALFSWKYRFPIFLAVSIGMFNQLSGINAILYYINDIFRFAGFSKVSGDLQAVAIGGTNLLFTMIAMSVIDKIGRKTLLLVGSVGTAICLGGGRLHLFHAAASKPARLAPGKLHSLLRVFPRRGNLGLHRRSLSQPGPRERPELGQFSHWFMNGVISLIFPLVAHSSVPTPSSFSPS